MTATNMCLNFGCLDASETVIGLPQNSLHVLPLTLLNSEYMKGLVAIC